MAEILHSSGVAFDIVAFPSGEALLSDLQENSAGFDLIFLDYAENQRMETAKAISQRPSLRQVRLSFWSCLLPGAMFLVFMVLIGRKRILGFGLRPY